MSRNNSPLGRMLTVIDSPNSSLRFLILDCPTESTLDFYMEEFMRLNVVAVARCCQPTYSANRLNERDIQVMDLPFKDGGVVSGRDFFFFFLEGGGGGGREFILTLISSLHHK